MAYLLGIDIGTSGTKTVLFDVNGTTIASDTQEYPLYQPRNGWAEQDPEDWWKATCVSTRNVIAQSGVNPRDIKGVGLSGQMHGLVLLDADDKVLRRSIIWCDQRSAQECEEITSLVGAKRLIEITANPALTGFTASKIKWVMNNEPEIYEKARKILLPKDYIRFCLTGEYATEVSDASGMQLLDVPNRRWSDEVLQKLGIDKDMLGKVYESQEVTGTVSKKAAELTGLAEGTIVVGGGGDQAAGAVGNGIVKPGVISSTIGTSGVVFAYTDKVSIDPKGRVHTFCHAVPNTWHIMGVTQGAGLSLQWFRNNFCHEEISVAGLLDVDPYYLIDKAAEKVAVGADGLIYLPYLMGERTPHLDPDCRGVFFGISAKHTKREFLRAVMEGVAYSLKNCLDIIKEMGIGINEVRASGGGGKSPLWRQIQADLFGTPICTVNSSEGPALGVALLAGVGAGIYKSVPEACDQTIRVVTHQDYNKDNHVAYQKFYSLYNDIYQSLKNDFKTLAKVNQS
ncbi:MAG: xylulokinase [Clostridiaceae bacterium]|jgi:xylulokinase|nr:xylulokinase [Clostridiaceae bacterium]